MSTGQEAARLPARPAPPSGGNSKVKRTILVVDDERDIVELISMNLVRQGFTVLPAYSGTEAIEITQKQKPDLIILDLMLPGMEGTDVCRQLKNDTRTSSIPIIMLTAKGEETDIVVGLTLGADDYVTKPFSTKVLLARINSVLRRNESTTVTATDGNTLRAGPLAMDVNKHEVVVDGEPVKLTLTEFRLLFSLLQARGRVLTRDQLMDKAMGTDVFVTDRAIDVHITAIRRKLGNAAWLIRTVRGVGYRLQDSPDATE